MDRAREQAETASTVGDSDLLPIALGLFSAVTLAVANVTVKRGGDILASRIMMALCAAAVLVPFAFFVPLPTREVWAALGVSLIAHFFYQSCMIRALHRGDLSLVFPIMRGLSPIITAAFAFLFLGEGLPPLAIAGLIIATGAVIYFGMPTAGGSLRAHPDKMALFWAVGTAVGIALYSVADARGVRLAENPFTYIVWLFLLDPIGVTVVGAVTRGPRIFEMFRTHWHFGLIAGVLSTLSFGSALLAMDMTEVARIAALRETAVVFAALLAWWFLKEGFGLRRTIAAAILALGLILLQLPS